MDQIIQYQLRRAVTGRKRLANKGTEPVPLIEKLLASLAKVYRHKKLQTGFQFDDDVFFHGEQGDLMELMGNLLDNACKFAISGSGSMSATRTTACSSWWRMTAPASPRQSRSQSSSAASGPTAPRARDGARRRHRNRAQLRRQDPGG